MPPFHSLTLVVCSSPHEKRAENLIWEIAEKIQFFYSNKKNYSNTDQFTSEIKPIDSVQVIGPIEAPMKKLRNRFRWQLLLKADNVRAILRLLKQVLETPPSTRRDELIQIDVDPHHLM
jgi:primosomal protein N' (replication factor Y)